MQAESILTKVENGVGWITLNRPEVLNSLNVDMITQIHQQLVQWHDDQHIMMVCITGCGEKGFCAGGDMRSLYDLKESNVMEVADQFFTTEYKMDLLIHEYPKPVLTLLNGIVMGGGVGISIGSKYRVVNEKTKWAMPEMNIGFFPDVGASFFLNKMPGNIGRYLALTSEVIKAEDVLYIGAADYFIPSETWPTLLEEIAAQQWEAGQADEKLTHILQKFSVVLPKTSSLRELQDKINLHFEFDSMEEIVQSLDKAANKGDQWASHTKEVILSKSPTSLKVTLKQLQKGSLLPLKECFAMERILGLNFMKCDDFYEGVRAVLVDKDRSPKWKPEKLESVKEADVDSFFDK